MLVCGEGAAHAIGQGRGAILILPNLRRLGRDRALPLRWVRRRAGLKPCSYVPEVYLCAGATFYLSLI